MQTASITLRSGRAILNANIIIQYLVLLQVLLENIITHNNMKRKAILFLCMLYTMIASAQFSGSGTGTINDPYAIYNAMQLDQVRNFCNKTSVYFKLMDDIDLTEWIADNNPSQGWVPIGNSSDNSFRGTFDGNNHKITGLYINRSSSDYVGLFGYLYTGYSIVKNLKVEGNVNGKNFCRRYYRLSWW